MAVKTATPKQYQSSGDSFFGAFFITHNVEYFLKLHQIILQRIGFSVNIPDFQVA